MEKNGIGQMGEGMKRSLRGGQGGHRCREDKGLVCVGGDTEADEDEGRWCCLVIWTQGYRELESKADCLILHKMFGPRGRRQVPPLFFMD